MRLLAIAAAAILASAGAEAACPPYHPACVSFGPGGFVRGTDRFGPYYGDLGSTRRGLYVERTAPAEAEPAAPRFRFDPYGRVIVTPPPRQPVSGADADLLEDEDEAETETVARPRAPAQAAARPRIPSTPLGPADAPQGPVNGYNDGSRSSARY